MIDLLTREALREQAQVRHRRIHLLQWPEPGCAVCAGGENAPAIRTEFGVPDLIVMKSPVDG